MAHDFEPALAETMIRLLDCLTGDAADAAASYAEVERVASELAENYARRATIVAALSDAVARALAQDQDEEDSTE